MNSEELTDSIVSMVFRALEDKVYAVDDLENLVMDLSEIEGRFRELLSLDEEVAYSVIGDLNRGLEKRNEL